ncbi:MAG TPA: redoxin domain-containing protein [Rubrobacteraceae bacterium]|nr:redoxin domain-containing protein [Rubrobacteraceae bacterium]
MARTKTRSVPEVGDQAPEFHLPSAQGGQLKLSMRTARGPVVVVFYSGGWSEEDVAYFKDLASKEDEINLAAASIVGIGKGEPALAHDFVRQTGIKSYVLYDYAGVATREYGLLEESKEHGEYARPATFIVDSDHKVVHAWIGERPRAEEILAKVSEITGLPKSADEEAEEKPKKARDDKGADEDGERKKLSPEEREKRRAERRAARNSEKDDLKPQGEPEAQSTEEREAGNEPASKSADGE